MREKICKLLHSDAIMTSGSGVAILAKVWFRSRRRRRYYFFQTLLFYNSYLITVSKAVCARTTAKKMREKVEQNLKIYFRTSNCCLAVVVYIYCLFGSRVD